jgi:manganese/iron transport system substrate-binding protein
MSRFAGRSRSVGSKGPLMLTVAVLMAILVEGCSGTSSAGSATPGSGSIPEVATAAISSLQPVNLAPGGKLKASVTTSLLAEAVRAVGGDRIDMNVIVPRGGDPHDFDPSTQDVITMSDSDVILMSGLGYEAFMAHLSGAIGQVPVVALSEGITPLLVQDELAGQAAPAGTAKAGEADPHVWFDPQNVIQWTTNASKVLSALDPANAATYQANAAGYVAQVKAIEQWAADRVAALPASHRKLVADHEVLGYLARRYGFQVVGAIRPEASDLAEPSARQIASLEDVLKTQGVRAIFVGTYDNHTLGDQIGKDTGLPVVPIYFESLSPSDGPASTYFDFMRFDVQAIVNALK